MKAETLKKAILQYAMQGKLIEQNPNDKLASELLKRIKAEKEELIKQGKIKKEKPLPPITQDEIPFELPKGWEWLRLGDIGDWGSGSTPNKARFDYYKNGTIPWLKTGDLNDGIIYDIPEKITEIALKETSVKIKPAGSLLIAMYGATIGKLGILNISATTNQACCACIKFSDLNIKFLFYYLLSERDNLRKKGEGGAQPNISREKIIAYLFPLPPLSEQQRIVEKLEEILPLVEEYGKNEEELEKLNKTLPDKIKQSILQHAVQGKLVPQNPNDEPASELLKRIKAEKEELIKQGKIKKEKPLPPITEDEIPYELPQGWEWVRIGTITDIGTGTTPPTSNYEYYNGNINWISSSSTGNDYIIEPDKLISQKAVNECNLRIYNPDTLIIALYGQGKTRGQITQLKIPSCINQACAAICIINKNLLNISYIKYFYKKQYNDIRSLAAGGAQPNLNVSKIKNAVIPLPPFAEQQRIVDKVEELMKIVDKIKE